VPNAKSGVSPLDEVLGLGEGVYSDELAQQMVWLAGLLTFEQSAAVFERLGRRHIPASSIWRAVQAYGERLGKHVAHCIEQTSPERVVLADKRSDHAHPKGVSLDGGMVNIRQEGWKEVKVGNVYDIELHLERDGNTAELVEMPHAVNLAYTAVLGDVQAFAPALWHVAVRQGVPTAQESSVTADGAEWIWNLVDDYFPDSIQIVDWYHAAQHLAQAAQAISPDHPDKAKTWLDKHTALLFQGQVHLILQALLNAGLTDHAHYFQTHQRRMNYLEFREDGWPIGSGSVESEVKQFKTRLSAAGMRWSRIGAQRMLIIRGAVLDDSFDSLWHAAA
jgi:hypothetical protein